MEGYEEVEGEMGVRIIGGRRKSVRSWPFVPQTRMASLAGNATLASICLSLQNASVTAHRNSVAIGDRLPRAQMLGSTLGPRLRFGDLRQVHVHLLVGDAVEQMPDQV